MITGSLHLREDAAVDLGVVVGRARRLRQRAARHQHDAPAELLDRRALLLVGADDVVDGDVARRARDDRCRRRSAISAPGRSLRGVEAAADQLERGRPVEPHAALRRVHGLGDAEPERPEMAAERDGALPVDGGVEPGIAVGQRIGDHMRGRIGDAVERRLRRREIARRPRRVGRELAAGDGEIERGHSRDLFAVPKSE